MSKLYEALQNARSADPVRSPFLAGGMADESEILPLAQAIEQLLPGPGRVVMITAAVPQAGASTIASRLARVASDRLGRTTLLMGSALPTPPRTRPGEQSLLAVGALFEQGALLRPEALKENWDRLRRDYELVVVDAPPAQTAVARAVAPTVDGVVLVIEAEQTPVLAALAARDSLRTSGANLLGMVVNKTRSGK